ncbi:MAG: imidazole glycerol phosphate synthase subunit HisH [Fibrobacter sp.]|nr:imidazole glycerol phosphate synthase subunit HisH [Fibrobacter sp.]
MIAIIDYDAGNLTSVKRALDYLQIESEITSEANKIRAAERIIFPGVGHATSAMCTLVNRGLDKAIQDAFNSGIPILGICLGTQIILSHSMEGNTDCLGLIDGECPKFDLKDPKLKIPHMGWNQIRKTADHPLLDGIDPGDEFYFVHSFYPQPLNQNSVFALCEYEIEFPAVIGSNNLVATQFHPEKSGTAGLRILSNFSSWDGTLC